MNERDYIKGRECLVDLYNSKNTEDYESFDADEYERINNIKGLVLKNFKNLELIDEALDIDRRTELTEKLLNKGYSIGRGALKYNDLEARIDIIENTAYGINVYVIDTSTKVSEKSKRKCEFIQYICEKLHIQIEKMIVIHIDNTYVREKDLNLNLLFKGESLKVSNGEEIEEKINEINDVIKGKKVQVDLSVGCIQNPKCKGLSICFPEVLKTDIFKIDGRSIGNEKKIEYFKNGIKTFRDVKEKLTPKNKFKIMLDAEIENKQYLNKKEIEKYLSKIEKFPLYFLDFETFQEAVPSYEGRRPYMQIPFQYSLHILSKDGKLTHKEYLGEEGTDTTRPFSESLIKDIEDDGGRIVVYNAGFESSVIKNMAEMHKDLRGKLEELNKRIVDLMIPFKEKHIYRKEMGFSYSIKKVLPSLCGKSFSYEGLNISNGEMAMKAFPNLIKKTKEEREEIRKDLLEYCKLDTLAMVKIYEELKKII
ncbi:MAG: DUF2779 domain-containing protein [Clostridium sp.]|uniref:DUF2779 domain-containing protein n=1 Tax=Clostridium sp. TaxID=1506 RepID=UPI003F3846AA